MCSIYKGESKNDMFEFTCTCERGNHKAPLNGYEISSGAIYQIPQILKNHEKIYLVADKNTYKAAGAKVEKILKEVGKLYRTFVIEREVVLPNAETLGEIILNANDPTVKSDIFRTTILIHPIRIFTLRNGLFRLYV